MGSAVSGAHRPACAAPAPHADADAAARAELESLLAATGRGDRAAFERLYRRTSARLYAVIGRSVWHRAEADEVLQELYLRVWNHAAAYDPARSHPMAWLGRIARNLAIDHLRRGSLRAHLNAGREPLDVDETTGIDLVAEEGPGPLDRLQSSRLGDQARLLLRELSTAQRRVILLTFWNGLTQTEVAECLGLPVGTVKSSVRRALMTMRDAMERQERRARRAAALVPAPGADPRWTVAQARPAWA